ncbi:MAG TPA: right-handed parallel beta-helix repeat-containing protein [Candidatus Dormibacteraeota bacterium]
MTMDQRQQHGRMRRRVTACAVGGLLAAASALAFPLTGFAKTATVRVHDGQSIQAAIAAAAPGTTIVVDEGTYAENLVIPKDGITLRGDGDPGDVRLVPPKTIAPVCGETPTAVIGICVADLVGFGPNGPVTATVHNVRISGITIQGFTDSGILMIDNSGARVDHVRSLNNGGYGMFALQSTGTRFTHNVAVGNHEAGFYIGESPKAAAVIADNNAHGNGFGIFFRDSRGAKIEDNTVNGNCIGILFLNTGLLPSGDGDATADDNSANRNSLACPAGDGPPTSGLGIAVAGGDHITLRDNTANGNVASGPTFASGGIVLGPGPGGLTTFIKVVDNDAHKNSTDIAVAVPSPTNQFDDNECTTSSPAGLC